MPTTATIGTRTSLWIEATAGAADWVKMGMVTGLTLPNESTSQIDVTDFDSPDVFQEFISGLTDPGDAVINLNHEPNSATDAFIVAWRGGGNENRAVQARFRNGATVTWPAFVKGYAVDKIAPAEAMKSVLTTKVAGAVVRG